MVADLDHVTISFYISRLNHARFFSSWHFFSLSFEKLTFSCIFFLSALHRDFLLFHLCS